VVVDTDLGWEILRALVALGRRDLAAVEARLAADDTTRGREEAAGARAASPAIADKRRAWELATTDETITNGAQRAIIAGFNQVTDPALLAEFVEPYFAGIATWWTTRSREMATNAVEGLYPLVCLNVAPVVELTDRWLAESAADLSSLRRVVAEGRADVVRALQAQKFNA
jgi:aminopeptidase N